MYALWALHILDDAEKKINVDGITRRKGLEKLARVIMIMQEILNEIEAEVEAVIEAVMEASKNKEPQT